MPSSTRGPELGRELERRLDRPSIAVLRRIGRVAAESNIRAFLVGGLVRDLLLGRPLRDLDVAVEGEVFALARRLGGALREHRAFGTATITRGDGVRVDLARTRRERYPTPAALPRVEPANLEQDLCRRDFTINAMALSLEPARFGRLIDTCGGRADIARGVLRVLHDRSFLDDPTRGFRAARFAARLGFRVERHTAALLDAARRSGVFDRLSSTRLRRELCVSLGERDVARLAAVLDRQRLFEVLGARLRLDAPRLGALRRVDLAVARGVAPDAEASLVAFGVILHDRAAATRERVLDRLQLARRPRLALEQAPREIGRVQRALGSTARLRASRIHSVCRGLPPETLLTALATASERRTRAALRRFLVELRSVRLAIGGDDLVGAGVPPGPAIARGLDAALAARLDGRAMTESRQLAAALEAIGET